MNQSSHVARRGALCIFIMLANAPHFFIILLFEYKDQIFTNNGVIVRRGYSQCMPGSTTASTPDFLFRQDGVTASAPKRGPPNLLTGKSQAVSELSHLHQHLNHLQSGP